MLYNKLDRNIDRRVLMTNYVCSLFVDDRLYADAYMHNWPLQPCGKDYGLASHTIHVMLCYK